MDDPETAMALGVNLPLVSTAVFALGAFVAGLSGVIGAQLVGVEPGQGVSILLLALVVVVVGGVGSIQGALLGGLLIGLVDAFGAALVPGISMFLIYLAMIVILLVRPSGLIARA
jgi:branched-subunit amino acid ABC-type transport system permease component